MYKYICYHGNNNNTKTITTKHNNITLHFYIQTYLYKTNYLLRENKGL